MLFRRGLLTEDPDILGLEVEERRRNGVEAVGLGLGRGAQIGPVVEEGGAEGAVALGAGAVERAVDELLAIVLDS